jgi:hypothetical protein
LGPLAQGRAQSCQVLQALLLGSGTYGGGAGGAVAKTHFRPPSSLGVCAPQCLSPAGLNRPNSTNSIPHKHIPPNPIWSTNLAIHTSGKALDHIALCTCMTDWKEIPLQVHLSRHPIARAHGMLGPWRYACTRNRLDKAVQTRLFPSVFDAFSPVGSCFTAIWAPFAIYSGALGHFFPGYLGDRHSTHGPWGSMARGMGGVRAPAFGKARLSRILPIETLIRSKSLQGGGDSEQQFVPLLRSSRMRCIPQGPLAAASN